MADDVTAFPFGAASATGWLDGGTGASSTSIPSVGASNDPNYWLPIWSGEVLQAYDQYNIFEPMVTTKTITSGTTMRFPITGTVGIKPVWGAGEELEGSNTISGPQWFDISLDQRPMASYFELDDISLLLTQWEYRSELARQAGLALANTRDKQIACLILQGALTNSRSPAVSKGGNFAGFAAREDLSKGYDLPAHADFNFLGNTAGTQTQRTTAALKLLEYIERYMVRLQQLDAPTTGVYVAVTPQAFQDIRSLGVARAAGEVLNSQPMFGGVAQAGGLGAPYTVGLNSLTDTLVYMGATIVKTNHLLTGPVGKGEVYNSAVAGFIVGLGLNSSVEEIGDQKYNTDWNLYSYVSSEHKAFPVKALIWQKEAIASLSLQGLKVDTVRDVRRNTFFTVASTMKGGGVLRPELCAAIAGAYPA